MLAYFNNDGKERQDDDDGDDGDDGDGDDDDDDGDIRSVIEMRAVEKESKQKQLIFEKQESCCKGTGGR